MTPAKVETLTHTHDRRELFANHPGARLLAEGRIQRWRKALLLC